MDPTDFRRRLDAAMEDSPPPTLLDADLAAGKNRLRRRRVTIVSAGLATAVMIGVPLAVLDSRDADPDRGPGNIATSPPTLKEPYEGWRWESHDGVEFQVPQEWDRAAASSWCISQVSPEDGIPRVSLPGMPARSIRCTPENGYGVSVEREGGSLKHPDGSPWQYPSGGGIYPDLSWIATVPLGDQVITIRTSSRALTERIASTVGEAASASPPTLPTSYDYVLTASCGERGFLGRYQVSVRDSAVVSVASLNPEYEYRPKLSEVPTLAGLLEKAETASPEAVVDLQVDEAGVPISLSIDHMPTAIDDEECYEVSELALIEP